MNFINPFDLLTIDVNNLNIKDLSSEIRKAKHKKLAEIDFSDNGFIIFNKHEITANEINKYADLLSDTNKREYYLFIAENTQLSHFLQSGNVDIFKKFQQQAIYKDRNFVEFISPFFTESYAAAYLQAFKNQDQTILQKMNNQVSLIGTNDLEKTTQKLQSYLENIIEEFRELKEAIDNENSSYTNDTINKLPKNITNKINIECLNIISDYLQTQKNQIAHSIRDLSVAVYNIFDDDVIALQIIELARAIETNGSITQNIEEAYNKIYEIWKEKELERKYKTQIDKYFLILSKLVEVSELITTKKLRFDIAKIISISDIREINSLPNNVFSEVRNQIAHIIRYLSVEVYNTFDDDITSLQIIELAKALKTDGDLTENISEAYKKIKEISMVRQFTEKYQANLTVIRDLLDKVEKNKVSSSFAYTEVQKNVPITQINNESSQADELKDVFCHLLSQLSVEVYNKYEDLDNAINILTIGRQINVSGDGKRKLENNYRQLSQMRDKKSENIRRQLLDLISVFSNMYSQIRNADMDNVNQEQIIKIFNDVFTRDVIVFVANATTHSELQIQLFENCKNIASKVKKKHSLAIIECMQQIGSKNQNLANRINQFKTEQQNRSGGFWDTIFGS
jgi:hypothetical protein